MFLDNPNILAKLNWTSAKKYWCALNVATAFGITCPWNANDYLKLSDHKDPYIWDVIVMDKWNKYFPKTAPWTQDWYNYWHVAVIKTVKKNTSNNSYTLFITDWPNSFNFPIDSKYIDWYISPQKMIELGAKNISLSDLDINIQEELKNSTLDKSMGYYEAIFKKEYPNGSTIYKDMEDSEKRLWDIAYFTAIWIERLKTSK